MKTKIMGIINATPDSFSDGGSNDNIDLLLKKIEKWVELGVDIIDIGGESTRPGSDAVPASEEISRVVPIIRKVRKVFPTVQISIDTMKYEVAQAAADEGINIINDVSGLGYSPQIADIAAKNDLELVLMHLPAMPKIMQEMTAYDDLCNDIFVHLKNRIDIARQAGVKKIIADVGIGFGKTNEDNWNLLANIRLFKGLGVPLLLGISRKSFIGELLDISNPVERDYATMIIHSIMYAENIDIIRVHNVELAVQMREIARKLIIEGNY